MCQQNDDAGIDPLRQLTLPSTLSGHQIPIDQWPSRPLQNLGQKTQSYSETLIIDTFQSLGAISSSVYISKVG